MDLHRNLPRPGTELGRRHAGVEQQGSSGTGPGLGQLLGGQHAEREAGIDDPGGQVPNRPNAALDDLAEADLLGVVDTVLEGVERAALE